MKKKTSKKKIVKRIITFFVLIALVSGFVIYSNDYYRAVDVDEYLYDHEGDVRVTVLEDDYIFEPWEGNSKVGIIFYPGGKVEYTSYAPLLYKLAQNGITCVLVKMPFNLAIFGKDYANGITSNVEADNWYLMGHSLGGAMISSYVSKHVDEFEGLILLAAYSTEDLNESDLKILTIRGSNDGVVTQEKYDKYRDNIKDLAEEVIISGGCHAYFGSYGFQEGDGTPTVTNQEQIDFTVQTILDFIK